MIPKLNFATEDFNNKNILFITTPMAQKNLGETFKTIIESSFGINIIELQYNNITDFEELPNVDYIFFCGEIPSEEFARKVFSFYNFKSINFSELCKYPEISENFGLRVNSKVNQLFYF